MNSTKTMLILMLTIAIVECASIRNREIGCKAAGCDTRELNFDQLDRHSALDIDLFETVLTDVKRGCRSPMCWFRPGKREEEKRDNTKTQKTRNFEAAIKKLHTAERPMRGTAYVKVTNGKHKREGKSSSQEQCNSPMCWFRGEGGRRETKLTKAQELFVKKLALRQMLDVIKRKKEQHGSKRKISEDRCSSPMCWFRSGREVNENMLQADTNSAKKSNRNAADKQMDTTTRK